MGSLGSFLFLLFLCLIFSLFLWLLLLLLLFLLLRSLLFDLFLKLLSPDFSISLLVLFVLLLLLILLVFLLLLIFLVFLISRLLLLSGISATSFCFSRPLLFFLGISLLLLLEVLLLLLVRLLLLDGLLTFVQCQVGRSLGLLLSLGLAFAFTVCELLELGDIEAVHVVDVRVDAARQIQRRVEPLLLVLGEAGLAHLLGHADLHQLHVACPQRIVHDPLVLLDGNRTCRITINYL